MTAAASSVRLVGWLADTGGEQAVAVHEDDETLHWYPVTGPTRDGQRAFDLTVPAGTGLHTYSVYALNAPAVGVTPAAGADPAAGVARPTCR